VSKVLDQSEIGIASATGSTGNGHGAHTDPRFPGYITRDPVDDYELAAVAEAAVARAAGRGALGPVPKGAVVLVMTNEDQDEDVMRHIAEAMRKAGASSVTTKLWSELGLPTGDFSAADGWRELSDEHVETVINLGERVQQEALERFLKSNDEFDCIYAGDAGEGHWKIVLGERFRANWMYRRREDLLARYTNFPPQLQRLIEQKVIASFGRAAAVRITDPEGTDISWDVTEEEATLWERGAWIPWHIIGTTIEGVRFAQVRPAFGGNRIDSLGKFAPIAARHYPTINGVVAGTVNHTGFFPHIKVGVEGGKISSVEGGGEYGRRLIALVDRFKDVQYPGYPSPGYHFINDATIGANPKTFRAMDTLWHTATPWTGGGNERYRAGVIHFGFGVEHDDPEFIKFGRENHAPIKHTAHVHAYFADYEIKDRQTGAWFKVIDRGHLVALDDPAVRKVASLTADPDDLLDYDWVPAIPGINYPGDYQRDYAQDPVPWIKRDVAGEFGRSVK
jgi:hypothetical protein